MTDNAGATVTIPDEDTTEMTTNVMLRDGQTAVLGGLFTETTTATRRQVPLLGDIPLIGAAFRGNDDSTIRQEIIFLITPSIVNDDMLADSGAMATQYVDHARVGARKSLLPFSRERRVGQLLIEARRVADEGDTQRALFLIERALRLSPQSPDARAMKTELTNKTERMPSRTLMNGILRRELLTGERPLVEGLGDQPGDPSMNETDAPTYAEVPTEQVSADEHAESWTEEPEAGWLTAEVEPMADAEAELAAFEDGFEDWSGEVVETADQTPEEAPEQAVAAGTPAEPTPTGRFDAMKTVATATPEQALPEDWSDWSDAPGIEQVAGAADLGGYLVIPLPGGGALHIEWPGAGWDWANTYTEVPIGPFENGVE